MKEKNLVIAGLKVRECRDFPIQWRFNTAMKVQVDNSWL